MLKYTLYVAPWVYPSLNEEFAISLKQKFQDCIAQIKNENPTQPVCLKIQGSPWSKQLILANTNVDKLEYLINILKEIEGQIRVRYFLLSLDISQGKDEERIIKWLKENNKKIYLQSVFISLFKLHSKKIYQTFCTYLQEQIYLNQLGIFENNVSGSVIHLNDALDTLSAILNKRVKFKPFYLALGDCYIYSENLQRLENLLSHASMHLHFQGLSFESPKELEIFSKLFISSNLKGVTLNSYFNFWNHISDDVQIYNIYNCIFKNILHNSSIRKFSIEYFSGYGIFRAQEVLAVLSKDFNFQLSNLSKLGYIAEISFPEDLNNHFDFNVLLEKIQKSKITKLCINLDTGIGNEEKFFIDEYLSFKNFEYLVPNLTKLDVGLVKSLDKLLYLAELSQQTTKLRYCNLVHKPNLKKDDKNFKIEALEKHISFNVTDYEKKFKALELRKKNLMIACKDRFFKDVDFVIQDTNVVVGANQQNRLGNQ